ncbi:DEAD/DEAH box helicase [Alkalilacustris brevis]|uniref:DEAD/DEAH box helicase n=1 Tax=Alkalilacustris brevis TaxID=2026338 RepID=UPI000E0D8C61|nr:DEAD/DEAH box helicase family protein [Alkalilacustris brevis]
MELKKYQQAALDALSRFLTAAPAKGPANAFAAEVARQEEEARLEGRKLEPRRYEPLSGMPEVPYVCLRLPTGGGKTLLAAEAIRLGADFVQKPHPVVLWMVTSDAIKRQTVEALKDLRHPYRARLEAVTGGRTRVFDIEEFETLRAADIGRFTCVVVATIQSFRVSDTGQRKVYAYHEAFEPHFAGLPGEGMEVVTPEDVAREPLLAGREGQVKFSFANLMYHHRPLMIVDEAHNTVTGLSREVQARLRPSAIIEFTATPRGVSNVLFSVTAGALKDEEMIKLPIRVRPHESWQEAVRGTVATRNMLEEKARREAEFLRPVALYQAQAKNGHPTVAELKQYLIEHALAPEEWIKVATGEQRELDGVNLRDPNEPTRHVITVQALREGWDCPSAYVLCATQKVASARSVEQLLGRVLRMPYAKRRRDAALNMAYAHVAEPSFAEVAASLRDKLIDMGFTDEEVRQSLRPATVEQDDQGRLFDPDPVAPKPVMSFEIPDTEEARAALGGLADDGAEFIRTGEGTLKVGVKGVVTEAVASVLEQHTPEAERPTLHAEIGRHADRVQAALSPAEKGARIEVPFLMVEMEGDLFQADSALIMERVEWSILNHPAQITEAEMSFRRAENVIEIDVEGEKLVYSQTQTAQLPQSDLGEPDSAALEATLVQWLEGQCRSQHIPGTELAPWLAQLVSWLMTERNLSVRTLIDWQYPLATRIRAKIDEMRAGVRADAYQMALFDETSVLGTDPSCIARFDAESYANVPTTPTGAFRLKRHLLGPDRVPLIDGDLGGDEFQCAWALDSLEAVDLWVRNLPRHPSSFWLPRVQARFYPDFIARLTDGRIFVVEYKGEHLVTAQEAREKDIIGRRWAEKTGNVFLTVRRMQHGAGPAEQMQHAIVG